MARFGLPGISSKIPADLKQFLDRVREWMTDADRAMVAKQDLIDAGLADVDRAGNVLPADPGAFSSIPPPVPLNVVANGAMTSILVEWDAPLYPNHAYAEIWASGVDDIGQAVLVGTSLGTMFAHAVGAGQTRYYWVRFISRAGIVGPYNAVAGTPGETSNDPAWVLGVLEGQLTEDQLYQDLTARIDLIDGTGVGSVNLRIADESTARAQAILAEATARQNGDGALQTQINMLSAASTGDLGELLAALQEEQTARINGDAAEVTARETLASQVRGNYTGTDIAQVTTGLVYSERQARTTADTALASRATALEATVNSATDGNAALKARIATEETARANADTAEATARTALAARVTTAEGNITTNAAAITAEQTARANADTALTSSVNTLSARLNSGGDVANAIVQSQTTANTAVTNAAAAQTTANSKNKTYFQTTAPASGMTAGDLWFDTDDSNKAYRYSGSAWVEAADARISSTASQVTTLQSTVAGHTTSIQTQQASIDGVLGKYSVKIDNNGYVTGFGLISAANNGTPVSEFAIVADKFSIAPVATDPATADGSPFFYLTTPTQINGVTVPAGAYMKSAYIADASITTAQIGNATMDAARVTGKLTANKIGTGELEATEEILVGGHLRLNGAGWLESYAAPGYSRTDDYARLDAGNLYLHRYVPTLGTTVLYNYLSRLELGVAVNSTEVTIPGYWKSQPRIIVSPNSLALFKTAYANQDQVLNCSYSNLVETFSGSGEWKFTPVATLTLGANTGSAIINAGSGDLAANSWTSATYTTPANCANITPSVSLKSQRGNGTSQWYYRSIRWRVEYWSGSAWVPLSWRTVNMGAQFNAITDSGQFTFPSAAAWQWRIYAEQYDTDGTVFGSVAYAYSEEVLFCKGAEDSLSITTGSLYSPHKLSYGTDTMTGVSHAGYYIRNTSGGTLLSPSSVVKITSQNGGYETINWYPYGGSTYVTVFSGTVSPGTQQFSLGGKYLGYDTASPPNSSSYVAAFGAGLYSGITTISVEIEDSLLANLVCYKWVLSNSATAGKQKLRLKTAESVVNTSWEIYQIDYAWQQKFGYVYAEAITVKAQFTMPNGTVVVLDNSATRYGFEATWVGNTITLSGTNLTYNRNYPVFDISSGYVNGSTTSYAVLGICGLSAKVKRRSPIPTTSTPSNSSALVSYGYNLTGAQVLATGSLNWMAVGE